MGLRKVLSLGTMVLVVAGGNVTVEAQNEILYDPEKGIMFIDKKDSATKGPSPRSLVSFKKKEEREAAKPDGGALPQVPLLSPRDSTDLHIGRKKDPPTLYFFSGLEYFKNGDYANALNNFLYADSVGKKPIYRLWVGKTLRQLNKPNKMLEIMRDIQKKHPNSDVADDALFEMAAYYQTIEDYDSASILYTKLSEQYPFGESHSTGERYIDVAQEQRKMMRAEMNNMLAILGYTLEDQSENFRTFQKSHRLPETGRADRATVQAIKKTYQKMLDREKQNSRLQEQAKKYLLWAGVAGALGVISILLSLSLLSAISERKRHLSEIRENIAELDTALLR